MLLHRSQQAVRNYDSVTKYARDLAADLVRRCGLNQLDELEGPGLAVVGGSGRQLENILDIIDEKLNSKGRILITAILVDTKVEAINKLKDLGYNPKIMVVNVSNGRVLDRVILMISENPIAIITAKKR